MKTEKIIKKLLTSGTSHRTNGIIALIGGLAAGAVLGILFAPESGESARGKIRDAAGRLFGLNDSEEPQPEEIHAAEHGHSKRPKSDIKSLIHEAHLQAESAAHPD